MGYSDNKNEKIADPVERMTDMMKNKMVE